MQGTWEHLVEERHFPREWEAEGKGLEFSSPFIGLPPMA